MHHADLVPVLGADRQLLTVWATSPRPEQLNAGAPADATIRAAKSVPDGFEDVLDQVSASLTAAFPEAAGLVVVADGTQVLLAEPLPDAPRAELVRVDALPSLAPMLEHRQSQVPFVIAVCDRQGADVYFSSDGGEPTAVDVPAADGPITKIAAGGWSQRRYQQRAENTWEATAGDIAAELVAVAAEVRPRVVLVGGDARTVSLVCERLPGELAGLVRELPGSRADDGSAERRDAQVRRWIDTAVAEDTVRVLRAFDRERGQGERAADGPAATLASLREGRVDVLCLHDDPDDARTAWYLVDDLALVAVDRADLEGLGVGEPREGRLADVAIRAAIGTGAAIRIVPAASPLQDRMGAILRW